MPIGGGGGGGGGGGLTKMTDTFLTVDTATFDFQSIVQTSISLWLVCFLRTDDAAVQGNVNLRFNNDSAANYTTQIMSGNNATVSALAIAGGTSVEIGKAVGNTATAGMFSMLSVWVPNYTTAVNRKTVCIPYGEIHGAVGEVGARSGNWSGTAAVTRVTLICSGNFKAGSRVTLYGLS